MRAITQGGANFTMGRSRFVTRHDKLVNVYAHKPSTPAAGSQQRNVNFKFQKLSSTYRVSDGIYKQYFGGKYFAIHLLA